MIMFGTRERRTAEAKVFSIPCSRIVDTSMRFALLRPWGKNVDDL